MLQHYLEEPTIDSGSGTPGRCGTPRRQDQGSIPMVYFVSPLSRRLPKVADFTAHENPLFEENCPPVQPTDKLLQASCPHCSCALARISQSWTTAAGLMRQLTITRPLAVD